MKSKTTNWIKNSTLCTEHLDSFANNIHNWCSNINILQPHFNFGINKVIYNKIHLLNNILKIDEIEIIFQDGTYINYNVNKIKNTSLDGKKSENYYTIQLNLLEMNLDFTIPQSIYIYIRMINMKKLVKRC